MTWIYNDPEAVSSLKQAIDEVGEGKVKSRGSFEKYNDTFDDIIQAHKYSKSHRSSIVKDKQCGCFYCLKIFSPTEICEYIPDKNDGTALCPYCGIDSVIGESCGFPINTDLLNEMNNHWF